MGAGKDSRWTEFEKGFSNQLAFRDSNLGDSLVMSHLIACRMATYRDCQDEAWTHLPTVGIGHLETWMPAAGDVDTLRGRLDASGLTLVMLDAKCDITADDHAEVLAPQLDRCAAVSCPIFCLPIKAGEMDRAEVYARLRRLGDEADRRDLTVVLETPPDLLPTGRVALETIPAVDHPRVRVNFDPANICYYNDRLDPIAELRTMIEFVHAVHLKDSVGRAGEWNFPPLGQGVVDFPALFADRKSTRLNSSHTDISRMPSSA